MLMEKETNWFLQRQALAVLASKTAGAGGKHRAPKQQAVNKNANIYR